jgi:hypothetical protein
MTRTNVGSPNGYTPCAPWRHRLPGPAAWPEPLVAAISTPDAAPVIAATQLRAGNLPELRIVRTSSTDRAGHVGPGAAGTHRTGPGWRQEHLQLDLADEPPRHRAFGWPEPVQNAMQLECQLASNGIYVGGPEGYRDPRVRDLKAGAQTIGSCCDRSTPTRTPAGCGETSAAFTTGSTATTSTPASLTEPG